MLESVNIGAVERLGTTETDQLIVALAAQGLQGLNASADLLHALPIPIYAVDAAGRLTFFNQAFARYWGVPLAPGLAIADQLSMTCDGGAPLPADDWPLLLALRTRSAIDATACEGVRADGVAIAFTSSPSPLFDPAGELVGAVDILIDLASQRAAEAKLRESEEHYRTAVELSPQMPWTADADGAIIHFNKRWCWFTGQTHEDAVRDAWYTVSNPEDLPGVRDAMRHSKATGEPFDARFRVRTRDGTERWVRARATARRDACGSVFRWYGSTEDIHDSVVAQQELALAEERYRYAALATRDVFWDHDLARNEILWSGGMQETFGYAPSGNLTEGDFWLGRIHPVDRDRVAASLADAIAQGRERWTEEYRFERADGSYAHVLDCGTLLRDETGKVVRAIGAMLDFTDRKRTEAELQLSEERLRLATAAAGLGISDFAVSDGCEHWSEQLRQILGLSPDMASGIQTFLALVHPEDLPAALEQHRRTRSGDFGHEFTAVRRIFRASDGELRWVSTQGHLLRNPAGRVNRVIITIRDITEEKLAQDQAVWAATHDALTRLPNKAHFQTALEAMVLHSSVETPSSLLLIDLDNFKHVNDTLGHQAGDALLVDIAARLGASVPAEAIVARFGGDEFAVILPDLPCDAALTIGRNILSALQKPCIVDTRSVDVRASIGVASCPGHGADASTLLQAADIALYAAKSAGRCTVVRYASAMRAGLQKQVSTLRQARQVIAAGTVVPYYQPKVSLSSMTVVGAEALLRWRHPRLGIQSAETLAAAFDDPELSQEIGRAMLRTVLADARRWLDSGAAPQQIAINASPVEVGQTGYADRVLGALHRSAVPPALLEVEITETALIGGGVDRVVQELEQLRSAGISIALDDFGTGFSSLSHLVRFPMDVIKVDRTFVTGLFAERADRAVVEAILRLSNDLGLKTVAEGVETRAQATALRDLGCAVGQGFLFSPAVAADAFDWRADYRDRVDGD